MKEGNKAENETAPRTMTNETGMARKDTENNSTEEKQKLGSGDEEALMICSTSGDLADDKEEQHDVRHLVAPAQRIGALERSLGAFSQLLQDAIGEGSGMLCPPTLAVHAFGNARIACLS